MNTNDFASLLWVLKMSRQNGVVHVELPKAERTEMGEMWRAHLHLVEGHVAACHVLSLVDERKLLSDDEALRWLAGWGQRELAWSREAFTLHKTAPRPAPADPLPPPRHVAPPQRVSQPADLPTAARYGSPPAPCRAAGRPFTVSQAEHTSTTDRASRTERDQFLASEAQAGLRLSRRKEKRQAYCNYIEAFPRGC